MPNNPLSKNITSRDEATNDLEKLVANMTGANIPEEQTSGLGKELKKILPGAGGLLPEYSNPEVGKVLGVEMGQSDIILFDCRIPNRDVKLSSEQGANTYVGSYPGFKAINDEIIGCYIIIGNTVVPTECDYVDNGNEIFIGYEDNDIQYRFFSNGKYTIINYSGADFTVHPSRISVTAYVSVPTAIWRDENELPIPTQADAGKAVVVNNSGEYALGNVGGGVFFVTDNENTLDKTWAEISAASENGVVVLKWDKGLGYLMNIFSGQDEDAFVCDFVISGPNLHGDLVTGFREYITSSENSYPVYE